MNIASKRIDEITHRLARLTGEDVETELTLSRVAAATQVDRRAAPQTRGEPLLFNGQDFANTDIEPAL